MKNISWLLVFILSVIRGRHSGKSVGFFLESNFLAVDSEASNFWRHFGKIYWKLISAFVKIFDSIFFHIYFDFKFFLIFNKKLLTWMSQCENLIVFRTKF